MIAKFLTPTWFINKLEELNPDTLIDNGIKVVFFDLDNTLIPYYEDLPYESTKKFIKYLQEKGLKVYVISNNHKERVQKFSDELGCKFSYLSYKPLTFRLKKFIKNENLNKEEIILVGDQLLTDVLCTKLLKIKSCLSTPACKGDLIKTKLNRFFDNIIRKKQVKKGYLKEFERSDYHE